MVILIICSTPHYVSTTSKFLSLWLKFFSFGGRLNKCGLEIVKTHQSHTLDTFPHWRKIPCGLKWKGVIKYCLLKSYFYFDATMKNWKICHQNRSRDAGSLPRSHSKNYSFEKYMIFLMLKVTDRETYCVDGLPHTRGLVLTQPVRNQPERTHYWD